MLKLSSILIAAISCSPFASFAQTVSVDVNLDIKHSVGGVSDFGRERHITLHAAISEPDWNDEADKMDYLLNDLDVYLGRDNGAATFHFQYTPQDPDIPNYPDIDEMEVRGEFWKEDFESLGADRLQYEARAGEMIMGTNPHPTYPTLSWYPNGLTAEDPKWQPKDVQTSADWVVEFLDKFFAKNQAEDGKQIPKYWEVINEPDMEMMTGQFMVTSQEKLWEYHNLVAAGVRERLGDQAPLIGGMTWGLHDFFLPDGVSRYQSGYLDQYLDEPTQAIHHNMSDSQFESLRSNEWYQWDVMWKGFLDACGPNMDFYSVHIYDWPKSYGTDTGGTIRSGGHVEAMLDMMEWYDLHTNGTRKPIVLSEYGAVGNADSYLSVAPSRFDWENIKPFSSMLMQFLERPDYLIKTMPFTPIKASWGDIDDTPAGRYKYSMMDEDENGDWQWTEYIKWFELWADVEGTRIDTKATDPDIQVDAYVDENVVYLILNNLERSDRTLGLNFHGEHGNTLQQVRKKHLYLDGLNVVLSDTTDTTAPASVTIGAESTMILAYTYANPVVIDETSNEYKYMGESLSGSDGTTPHRVTVNNGKLTAYVNDVAVPTEGEAMLRICGSFWWVHVTNPDPRNKISINGHELSINGDWRGEDPYRNKFFAVLEVPVPLSYLQEDNTIECELLASNDYTNVSIQVWDMSQEPGRTAPDSSVSVTGVTVNPSTASLAPAGTVSLTAVVAPADATDATVLWSSSDESVATVSTSGLVTAVAEGTATITATTNDGGETGSCVVTVSTSNSGGGGGGGGSGGTDIIAAYLEGTSSDGAMPATTTDTNVVSANVVNTAFTSGPVRNSWGASFGNYRLVSAHNGTNATDIGASASNSEVLTAKGYSWTITANSGYQIDLGSLEIDFAIAASGNSQMTDWGYRVFVDIDGGGYNSVGTYSVTKELSAGTLSQENEGNHPVSGLSGDGGSVTIKLVDWGKVSANSNQFGTSANVFQQIVLKGSVIEFGANDEGVTMDSFSMNSETQKFTISFSGNSQANLGLYYSDNLVDWYLDRLVSDTDGILSVDIPENHTSRFYVFGTPSEEP